MDWARLLLGNTPLEFLVETLLRSIIMYEALLIILRFLGKRMNSQATIAELSVMLMLGAIMAMPIESADRGIVPGLVLLVVVLLLERCIASLSVHLAAKRTSQVGNVRLLVADGVANSKILRAERISQEQLFSVLRQQNVTQLGQVERLYLEANGAFSLFLRKEPQPGLCVFPRAEAEFLFAHNTVLELRACSSCGQTSRCENNDRETCQCASNQWSGAIL